MVDRGLAGWQADDRRRARERLALEEVTGPSAARASGDAAARLAVQELDDQDNDRTGGQEGAS